jgi:hypothetical protein
LCCREFLGGPPIGLAFGVTPAGFPLIVQETEMRSRTLWLSLIFATSLALQSPTQAEEYRGTFGQQLACTPDVLRLCGSEMPDVNRIVACLRQNTAQLGDDCKAVFEAKDSVPSEPAPAKRASH